MNVVLNQSEEGLYIVQSKDNPVYTFEVYPLDISRSAPPEEITCEVVNCLISELESRDATKPRDLLGNCHKNAMNLFTHLYDRGYDPSLHIGCNTDAGTDNGVIYSFKKESNAHQWVSLDSYTVEICSEATQAVGQVYVSDRVPNNYTTYHTLSPSQVCTTELGEDYIDANNIETVLQLIE